MNPKNYFIYHFTYALPNFVKSRPQRLAEEARYLNIFGLIKNLFAPYRRLTLGKKASLADRLSFELVSRGVGAVVRLFLITFGVFLLLIFAFVFLIQIILYIPPIASLPDYFLFLRYTFFDFDIATGKKFVSKLERSSFFKGLKLFFDDGFSELIATIPAPNSLAINAGQNLFEMFSTLSFNWPKLQQYLARKNINNKQFAILIQYLDHFYNDPTISKKDPIGYSLIYGYTNTLDTFCTELTHKKVTSPYFNKALVDSIEKILTRPHANNAIMIGEVGVGKHSGIVDLASAITRRQIPSLNDKKVLLMDTVALLSSSKNLLEIKANFEALLQEAKHAGNIILVVDYVDKISSTQDGRIDLSEVLNTVLNDNSLPIIGITTYDEFNKYIRTSPQFLKLFEKVEVFEPKEEETIQILIGYSLEIYAKVHIACDYQSILEIVDKSERLMQEKRQPEKSTLLLDDSIARAQKLNKKQVTIDIVDEVLSERTKIPIGKIETEELEKLKDLEGYLHKRIVGQDEAIVSIAKAMRRSRTGLERGRRPMGSFLFLGPTGVGKTETAKALADAFFGAESKMIRLDMTEFREQGSTKRLIGDMDTKTPGQLTSLVLQNPYGLLLVDEFEKADPYVQNLFLQIIDEGNLTDAFGKKVSFTNIIIIATSNAGAEFIREEVVKQSTTQGLPLKGDALQKGNRVLSTKLIEYVLSKGLFNPELLNRFDAVVVYKPLSQQQVLAVSKLMLAELAAQIKETKNITLQISDQLAQAVATKGYNIEFGARPIRRLIQDRLEDGIAKMIISGRINNGETIPAQTLLSFVS